MECESCSRHPGSRLPSTPRRAALSLVELLTVIFIIALLIGILIPTASSARNQAKNTQIKAYLKWLSDGLENFKGDYESEFRGSNGYPPSAFVDDATSLGTNPTDRLAGAHWMARYLVGKDLKGFVSKKAVPPDLVDQPEKWYLPDATSSGALQRAKTYVNPANMELVVAKEIKNYGAETVDGEIGGNDDFPEGESSAQQYLFRDTYGGAILYYVANPLAKTMTRKSSATGNEPATYTQEDNLPFTGSDDDEGWQYADKPHPLAIFGDTKPGTIHDIPGTFCDFIHDETIFEATSESNIDNAAMKAVNPKSFLLISAGRDGVYGTVDDITNFQRP